MSIDVRERSYLGDKFLLNNYKKDLRQITTKGEYLRDYSLSFFGKDVMEKTYYDTPDKFFRSIGINISTNKFKGRKMCELIVRYDSNVERLAFLSEMPDTFKIYVNASDKINKYYNFIANSIYEILPAGRLGNINKIVTFLRPILIVSKNRARYRATSTYGLKVNLSFDFSTFINPVSKHKEKMPMLELTSESYELSAEFKKFSKYLIFEYPQLIKLKHSDLFIGEEYLGI